MRSVLKKYYQPTPVRLRRLGDTIMIGCTSLMPIILASPLSDKAISWIVTILGVVGVAGKIITNFFTTDEPKTTPPNQP